MIREPGYPGHCNKTAPQAQDRTSSCARAPTFFFCHKDKPSATNPEPEASQANAETRSNFGSRSCTCLIFSALFLVGCRTLCTESSFKRRGGPGDFTLDIQGRLKSDEPIIKWPPAWVRCQKPGGQHIWKTLETGIETKQMALALEAFHASRQSLLIQILLEAVPGQSRF